MLEKVCSMIAEQLGVDAGNIKPEQEIVKDLGADSLDIVELMMAMEEEYGVTLPESDMENVKTVQDVVDLMTRLQN